MIYFSLVYMHHWLLNNCEREEGRKERRKEGRKDDEEKTENEDKHYSENHI